MKFKIPNTSKTKHLPLWKALLKKTYYFLLIYISISLVFSLIYFTLSRSFYHQNPQQDPAFFEIKERVLKDLCDSLSPDYKINNDFWGCLFLISGGKEFAIKDLSGDSTDEGRLTSVIVSLRNITSDSVTFNLQYNIQKKSSTDKGWGATGGSGDDFTISLKDLSEASPMHIRSSGTDSLFVLSPPVDNIGIATYTEYFIKAGIPQLKEVSSYSNSNGLFFTFPPNKSLIEMANYLQNTPVREPSLFKSIYFSAMTLASFGFGEVIPISYTARAIVAIEVILGIVLFGLFITAVYNEYENYRFENATQENNIKKINSLSPLWSTYYQSFIYSAKGITEPISTSPFDATKLHFSMLQNLYSRTGRSTSAPLMQFAYIKYFQDLDKIAEYLKTITLTLDYERNAELFKNIIAAIVEIENNRYSDSLAERQNLKVGEKFCSEFDIDVFKKDPDILPVMKPSNAINLYVAIWESLHNINDILARIDKKVTQIDQP